MIAVASDAVDGILVDGEEGRDFVNALARNGKLDRLGRLWLAGAVVDWRLLWAALPAAPRRISLPAYPFERKRFWFDSVHESAAVPAPARIELPARSARPARPAAPPPSPLPVQPEPSPARKVLLRRIAPPPVPRQAVLSEAAAERPAEGRESGDGEKSGHAVPSERRVLAAITSKLARVLYMDEADVAEDRPFVDMGLDSILGVELIKELNRTFGVEMKASRLFDHPTAASLAAHVAGLAPAIEAEEQPGVKSPRNGTSLAHIGERIRFHLAEVLG